MEGDSSNKKSPVESSSPMEVEPKTMSNKVLPVYDANTRSAFEAYKVSVLEVTLFLFSADKILSIQ